MAFKSVFDADFRYRSADSTDIRLTFARIRREQRMLQQRVEQERRTANVVRIAANGQGHWPFPENDKNRR